MDIEEALDRLYAAPLEEFTATRNALAMEFAGDTQAAVSVKSLKKPNLAAWALNQLAQRHPDKLDELFEATDKLRRVQRRVLSGGKPAELRHAADERNKVVRKLTKLAGSILTKAGHGASTSTLSAIGDSLVAVAADEQGAEQLRAGRLTRELEASAFVDVGGLTVVRAGDEDDEGADGAEPERDAAAVQRARRELAEAREAVKSAKVALKKANAEAQRLNFQAQDLERRAKSAREKADFAQRAADARASDLEEAEKAEDEQKRALEPLT